MARRRRRTTVGEVADNDGGGGAPITLSFRRTRCRRCGALRVVTQACGDCGAAPSAGEADPAVQRRQRAATLALAALCHTEQPPEGAVETDPPTFEEVCGQLAGWPARFLGALSRAGDSAAGASALCELLRELRQVRARVDRPVRRPWRATCRAAARTIDILEDAARGYLRAFGANTPLEAQRDAEAGQAALDSAAAPVAEMRRKLDRVESIKGISPGELLPALAASAAADEVESGGIADLLALDAAGGRIYTSITGSTTTAAGVGVGLRLATVAVEVTLDYDRFIEVASRTYSTLVANPDVLRRLATRGDWRQAQQDAIDELFELGVTSAAMAAAAVTDRMTVDVLLQSVHRIIEGPAQHLLATLLAVAHRRDYARLLKGDAAGLLNQVQQSGYGPLIEGLRADVRNAAAHRDFRVGTDTVVLAPKGAEATALSGSEFVDIVLAAQESTLAMLAGALCALAALDIELEDGRAGGLPAWVIPDAVGVRTVLALAGWTEVEATVSSPELHVEGVGEFGNSPSSLVAALLPALAPQTERVTLVARQGDVRRTLVADIEPLRRYSEMADGEEREAQFLLAVTSCTLDGTPLVSDDEVDRWFTAKAERGIQLPLPEAIRVLRSLMSLADALQRPALADRVRQVIRALRQG